MSLNLLPSEAKFQAQKMKIKAIINNFLWIVGGIWVLLILITFGTGFFLNFKLSSVNKKYQAKLNDYKSKMEEIVLTQKIKYQAKVVAKVLDSRFEYGESMNLVSNIFSSDIKLDDIQIGKDKIFTISGTTLTGEAMNEVEKKVAEINNGSVEGLASAEIKDVAIEKDSTWSFTVGLTLKKITYE